MIVKGSNVQLFNLGKDIGEGTNLVDKFPERAKAMKMAIEAWKESVAWK
jgi:hypothetical protein